MFATLEERLIVFGLFLLLLIVAVGGYSWHERTVGAAEHDKADLKLANDQLARNATQLAAYQKQLGDADAQKLQDTQTINTLQSRPVPHLLCHSTAGSPVPNLPAASSGVPAASGNATDVREPDFSPVAALTDLSAGYERRVETCRDALNRWPVP